MEEKVVELYFKKNNIIEGTIKMRTIKAIKFKREQFEDLKKESLKTSGIYLLFGSSITGEITETTLYIGKASEITQRLSNHKNNEDKEFWTETVILTTTDNTLGETEIKYLESKFIEIVRESNRCNIINKDNPNLGNVSDSDKCVLNTFIDDAKILMKALGYNILEKIDMKNIKKNEERWHVEGKNYNADVIFTSDKEAIVLKGSKIGDMSQSLEENVRNLRENNKSKIKDNKLLEDIVLKSPNIAVRFITGFPISSKELFKKK